MPDLMAAPRSVLLAWEGGAGRGHVVTLKAVAAALGPGFVYDAALCRMDHAAEIAPFCRAVFPSARLWENLDRRRASGGPRTASWGEFLGDLNFADRQFLVTQLGWWRDTIRLRQIDLLVGDFAPCALLAARLAGIPAVTIGTGYSVPTPGLAQFPQLLPEYGMRIYDEADLLATLNAALAHFGGAPLALLSDIYAGVTLLPRTIAGLDPYYDHRDHGLIPPLNEQVPLATGQGDEIYAYFSTAETEDPALVEAIAGLGLPVRAFLPGASPEMLARFAAGGVSIERAPVPVADIARRTRLFLHAGQHGSLCMGLGLGVPQIAIPQHLEHLYHARRATALSAVSILEKHRLAAPDIGARIHAAYHDAGAQAAARSAAQDLAPTLYGDAAGAIRGRILSALG